jgi:hypothetical protein
MISLVNIWLKPQPPIVVSSMGRSGSTLCAKQMQLEPLIERLGPGFESAEFYNVLKCPACKSRKFLVMFSPVHVSYGNLN